MTNEEQNKKINHDILKWIIIGLAGFVVVILVFGVGVFVGGIKARFSYRWAESYHKNFGGPRNGFFGDWQKIPFPPDDFIEGHGVFGEIIKINPSTDPGQVSDFVIKGQGDVEKIIVINKDTVIKKNQDSIKISDLKVDDFVVVIGQPNDAGQIEAKLIRVLPLPPKESSFSPLPFGEHQ